MFINIFIHHFETNEFYARSDFNESLCTSVCAYVLFSSNFDWQYERGSITFDTRVKCDLSVRGIHWNKISFLVLDGIFLFLGKRLARIDMCARIHERCILQTTRKKSEDYVRFFVVKSSI